MRKLTPAEIEADWQRTRAEEAQWRENRALQRQMTEDRITALEKRIKALENEL